MNKSTLIAEVWWMSNEESIDVRLGHGDHHVHIQRGPRLTTNRAGNRAADNVLQSTGFKGVCHLQGDLNQTERHS